MKYNILIVEDDSKLRNELSLFFKNNGYDTIEITNFDDTVKQMLELKFDLALLDINLPNVNGEAICKEVRKNINTPIIMVTSRNTEIDELISINNGADDFVTKPYNTQILLARVERLLKRANVIEEKLEYKDCYINISKSIIVKDKEEIDLSKNELKILIFLIKNKEKIVSRDDLMNYLWNSSDFIDDNTLTVNITRLRGKLDSIGYNDVIVTKRGQGYILL